MRCIDIPLGGSRKVKVGLRENVYLHLDTWRHPYLCTCTYVLHAPLQPSHQRQWWRAVSNQDPISFSIDFSAQHYKAKSFRMSEAILKAERL